MKKLIVYILLVSSAVISILYFEQRAFSSEPEPPKISIRVELRNSEESLKNEAESQINRELRSLGDVVVVDSNPDYHLYICTRTLKTQGGEKIGIVFSAVALRSLDSRRTISDLTKSPKFPKKNLKEIEYIKKTIEYRMKGAGIFIFNFIQTAPSEDHLQRICEELVADFDIEILKLERKFRAENPDLEW